MVRRQSNRVPFWAVSLALSWVAGPARADRGEAFLEADVRGGLSFVRNPALVYKHKKRLPDAATLAFGGKVGLGLTDWMDVGLGARWYLPRKSTGQDVSLQGFVSGDVVFRHASLQIPASVSLRRSRGGPMSIVVLAEVGVEVSHWEVISMARGGDLGGFFAILPFSVWTTSYFAGLHAAIEWRYFDRLAVRFGPSISINTEGTAHLGLVLAGDFLWGLGLVS